MKKIPLTSGFQTIPEGRYVFTVSQVEWKEDFGKMEITLTTGKGLKHKERFTLLKNGGEVNEGAMNAFSFFAKTVMNDFGLDEVDPQELVGHSLEATVEHDKVPSNRNPEKTVTFARLCDMEPVEEEEPEEEPEEERKLSGIDWGSLFGNR